MSARADDLDEIKQLKARYFRYVDTKDWEGLREVFAHDAVFDIRGSGGDALHAQLHDGPRTPVITGAEAIVALIGNGLAEARTVHHGHMPEIEFSSPTTASGIWAMEDLVEWPGGLTLHGYGHYHDIYQKVDGRWRITRSALTRLRVDIVGGNTSAGG